MFRLLSVLFGFAVFGALFAAIYYQPADVERTLPVKFPKFFVSPGAASIDYLERVDEGERIFVNITVLEGPPVHVFVVDFENLTTSSFNATTYGFELTATLRGVDGVSRHNLTGDYDFTWIGDGENRWALLLFSSQPLNESIPIEEQTSLVAVSMRYIDREERSLLFGYLMATPSVVLIAYTLWLQARRIHRGEARKASELVMPRDRDL